MGVMRPSAWKNFSALPEVEIDMSFRNASATVRRAFRGSLTATRQPFGSEGGAPIP